MKEYKVLPEYVPYWTNECDEVVVNEEDLKLLAAEWDVPVSQLLEQCEEI